jgi:GLPGLI family protein
MKWIIDRKLLFFLHLCMVLTVRSQDHLIRYSCVFNDQFDREEHYRYFNAELHISGNSSYFFMTPDEHVPLSPQDPNAIYVRLDTLLRIAKLTDDHQLVFGDITISGKENFYMDSLYPMQWELVQEQRDMDSMHCSKAVALFRGRRYICWYCPDIPLNDGPWKLGGLPGLIVEAYDEEENLHFRLLSYGSSTSLHIPISMSGILPDFEQYKRYWRDLSDQLQASMGITESSDCVACQTKSKIKIYLWEKVL